MSSLVLLAVDRLERVLAIFVRIPEDFQV